MKCCFYVCACMWHYSVNSRKKNSTSFMLIKSASAVELFSVNATWLYFNCWVVCTQWRCERLAEESYAGGWHLKKIFFLFLPIDIVSNSDIDLPYGCSLNVITAALDIINDWWPTVRYRMRYTAQPLPLTN